MSSSRHVVLPYEGRSGQAPGMMKHGPFPGLLNPSDGPRPLDPLPRRDPVGNRINVQAAEMERLARDNEKLAATHVSLRQQLVATHQEIQRLQAHIRSIHAESDIQIRIMLEKTAKMEVDIRAGENLKKELEQAHKEAQSLVKARQELTEQIQKASQELQKSHTDIKKMMEMQAELDGLRQEHQILRITFEHEKGRNVEQVEQLQAMEKNMVGMARELERLRVEVLNAEARAQAAIPYGGQYLHQDPSHPPPTQSTDPYMTTAHPPYPPPTQSTDPYMTTPHPPYSHPPTHSAGPYMTTPHPPYPPTQGNAPYFHTNHQYPPPPQANMPYLDAYGRPLPMGMFPAGEGMMQYGGGNVANMPPGGSNVAGVPPGGVPAWNGAYDPALAAQGHM